MVFEGNTGYRADDVRQAPKVRTRLAVRNRAVRPYVGACVRAGCQFHLYILDANLHLLLVHVWHVCITGASSTGVGHTERRTLFFSPCFCTTDGAGAYTRENSSFLSDLVRSAVFYVEQSEKNIIWDDREIMCFVVLLIVTARFSFLIDTRIYQVDIRTHNVLQFCSRSSQSNTRRYFTRLDVLWHLVSSQGGS